MKYITSIIVAIAILSVEWVTAQSAGTLDSAFGENGVAAGAFVSSSSLSFWPDKKIQFGRSRFTPEGILDTVYELNTQLASVDFSHLNFFKCLPNGKLAVGVVGGTNGVIKIFMLNADGSADTSYGTGGYATFTFPYGQVIQDVLIHPNGSIFLAGGYYLAATGDQREMYVARITPEGIFSMGGTSGIAYWNSGYAGFSAYNRNEGTGLTLLPNGQVVLCGYIQHNDYTRYIYLKKFTEEGYSVDAFGQNGQVFDQVGLDSWAKAITTTTDGKLIVVGQSEGVFGFATKYSSAGVRDMTFNNNLGAYKKSVFLTGKVAVQPDGKILILGNLWDFNNPDTWLVRLKANGVIDNTFSGDGLFEYDAEPNDHFLSRSLALQSNGKILLGGSGWTHTWLLGIHSGLVVAAEEPYASYVSEALLYPNLIQEGQEVTVQYSASEVVEESALIVDMSGRTQPVRIMDTGDGQSFRATIPNHLAVGKCHLLFMDGEKVVRATFVKVGR